MTAREAASDDELLQCAVRELADLGGFPIAFGGYVRRGAVTISTLVGNRGATLDGLRVESDRGLGGRALAEARPRVTTDYGASPHITHDYDGAVLAEGIRSLLAVPIIVGRTTRGVIYGGVHAQADVGGVLATPAIRIAAELGKELAVREEVERRLVGLRREAEQDRGTLSAAQLAELREGVAELRGIAASVGDDPDLRARLAAVEQRLASLGGPSSGRAPSVALAPREKDVLGYVAIGRSNAQIARELDLAESTVKAYLGTAMQKLGARTRYEAVQLARQGAVLA